MKKILITGGTGFIGKALIASLLAEGYEVTVLSRDINSVESICGVGVKAINSLDALKPEDIYQIVINLAGAPIFDARWSDARKQIIRDSRINLTQQLVSGLAKMSTKPELLISGSAIGYYGDHGATILTEHSGVKEDFSQQLCADWENEAKKAEQFGIRVCLIRTGLVLGEEGGLLQRMLLPFKWCLGGRLGTGQQWMSWIHREDWIAIALKMIIDATMSGAYNATAPNPVTNSQFTKALADALNRPALLPVPAWLLKKLLGEMSELVLGSQRVFPERLLAAGFKFKYATLSSALTQLLSRP
jgi:uncharacterized protein (TIGR01777 family)